MSPRAASARSLICSDGSDASMTAIAHPPCANGLLYEVKESCEAVLDLDSEESHDRRDSSCWVQTCTFPEWQPILPVEFPLSPEQHRTCHHALVPPEGPFEKCRNEAVEDAFVLVRSFIVDNP